MIGVFDSGLGGLTAVRALAEFLPQEKIVYFGDTGRVPYGTRSRETLLKYSAQDMRFLLTHPVSAVLVACGTVSSVALDDLRDAFPVPVAGVVAAAARRAAESTENGKIAVIGTGATVSSGAFERTIGEIDPALKVKSVACPIFVPLVENGWIAKDDEVTRLAAERYLAPIREFDADTLILGCTHFPLIADTIARVLPGVTLVNSGAEAARELASIASARGLLAHDGGGVSYFVSDEPQGFRETAEIFLGHPLDSEVVKVDIEQY